MKISLMHAHSLNLKTVRNTFSPSRDDDTDIQCDRDDDDIW